MKITSIELTNVRGFKETGLISLSNKINLFIGANNAGKSTILNAIFLLQRQNSLKQTDITIGETQAQIIFEMDGTHSNFSHVTNHNKLVINLTAPNGFKSHIIESNQSITNVDYIAALEAEPNNLIYPYL